MDKFWQSFFALDVFWRLFFAFLVGLVGSLAYVSIVYFKFIGKNDAERQIILKPFLKNDEIHILKLFWYCIIGGLIAAIFQYPESTFVSIQSFLLGVGWPSLVLHHISGRMKDPSEDEINENTKQLATSKEEIQAKDDWEKLFESVNKK